MFRLVTVSGRVTRFCAMCEQKIGALRTTGTLKDRDESSARSPSVVYRRVRAAAVITVGRRGRSDGQVRTGRCDAHPGRAEEANVDVDVTPC